MEVVDVASSDNAVESNLVGVEDRALLVGLGLGIGFFVVVASGECSGKKNRQA